MVAYYTKRVYNYAIAKRSNGLGVPSQLFLMIYEHYFEIAIGWTILTTNFNIKQGIKNDKNNED